MAPAVSFKVTRIWLFTMRADIDGWYIFIECPHKADRRHQSAGVSCFCDHILSSGIAVAAITLLNSSLVPAHSIRST